MAATQSNSEAKITISSLDEDVLLLRDMSMTEELGRLFEIDLELLSEQRDINFEEILGQNVTIELKYGSAGKRYFNGHVTQFSQSEDSSNYATYQAIVRPWFWFLTRTADCRIFQEMTVPDIVEEVFQDLGFTDFEYKLSKTYRTWEYCVQYRETDFNFVSRLLEQEGIYYYFTHDDGVHNLVLCDEISAHQPLPDYATIDFYPQNSAAVREKSHIFSWYISKKVQSGKYVLNEFDFKNPKADLISNSDVVREHDVSDYEIYDYPGEYVRSDDGKNYVQARIEELHSQYEEAKGKSNVRVMSTGGLFSLDKYSRTDQNREYLVVSASHHIQGDVYETSGGNGGEIYSNDFSVIDSQTPYRAARVTPKPIVQGTQTAIVVGPSGEEIYTDEYGRVKLQFHWDRIGDHDENSSCWVRVAQLWAGKKWGGIHIPRIGQEVIVDFMEGDPDRPIITGRVYNADQMPPYNLPANKTQSGIKSRSSMGGSGANFNEIRMEDKKGSEELYIHAEKDQNTIVENDQGILVQHDQSIRVDNDRGESIGRDRSLLVERDKSEKVLRNKAIDVLGGHSENIAKSMEINIGSNLNETVAVNYAETVGAAMELSVGGLLAVSVGAVMTEVIGGNKTQTIGISKVVVITGSQTTTVGKGLKETVGKDKNVKIEKDLKEVIGGQHTESVEEEYLLQAKKIQLKAEDELSIKVGKAELIMKKNGDISIKGKKINLKGTGDVVIIGSKIKEN